MEVGHVLDAVRREVDEPWTVLHRFVEGWQGGAWLLGRADGSVAVLKFWPDALARVQSSMVAVAAARHAGWPTPEWLGAGEVGQGYVWLLQEFVDGTCPERLDADTAAGMAAALDVQAGLAPDLDRNFGTWAHGVVFEDWDGLRRRVSDGFPGGDRICRAVDQIAARVSAEPLSSGDLVHAEFSRGNVLLSEGRVWLVDAQNLGRGPRAYDVAEALLLSAAFENATKEGEDVLWSYARTLDAREFAVCAGSISLTLSNAFIRLGHIQDAPAALPGALRMLDRVTRELS